MTETNPRQTDREPSKAGNRIAFDVSGPVVDEIDRILAMTELKSRPDVFRRAFTLLRIHVDAALNGKMIYMEDPDEPNVKTMISLPFDVYPEKSLRS